MVALLSVRGLLRSGPVPDKSEVSRRLKSLKVYLDMSFRAKTRGRVAGWQGEFALDRVKRVAHGYLLPVAQEGSSTDSWNKFTVDVVSGANVLSGSVARGLSGFEMGYEGLQDASDGGMPATKMQDAAARVAAF